MSDREFGPVDTVVPIARYWHVIREIEVARLLARQDRRERLCDALEACADALPDRPSDEHARQLCAALDTLAHDQDGDDDRFLRSIFHLQADDPLTDALLGRIMQARIADAATCQELIAALTPQGPDQQPLDAEAMGYLLRCCFTAWRQAIAFEELAILTLADRRLTREAREMLIARIAHRAP